MFRRENDDQVAIGAKGLARSARRLGIPSLLYFGYTYILWLVMAYMPIYLSDLGLSDLQVSILISVFPLTALLLLAPFGLFSDRLSPKKLVTAGLVVFALFLVGLRHTTEFWLLLLLFILGGIGGALFRISNPSLFYKFLGENHKGIKLGFFAGIGLLGYGLGPLTGGFLLARFDMAYLFVLAFWGLIPLLLLSLLPEDVEPIKFKLIEYRRDMARKEVLVLVILTYLQSLHLGVEQTCFSLFLENNIGLNWGLIGRMFCFIGIGISMMCIINGFVNDRATARGKGLGIFLYLGMFLSGLFNINLVFGHSFDSVLAIRLFHIVGDSLFIIGRFTITSNLFLAERIGGNLGLIETMVTVGTFSGALISGFIPGYLYPFLFAGSVAILAIPFARMARPKF